MDKFIRLLDSFDLWYIRTFKVISNQEARDLELKFLRNVYGDEINILNCRSIWIDNKQREYRVRYLSYDS
jgi:hypothetical protein